MVQETKTVAEKLRRRVYWTIASVAMQVRERKGPIGNAANRLEAFAQDAEKLLDSVFRREELDEKYKGIGAKVKVNLTEEDYKRCLSFYAAAESSIPSDEGLRAQVLEDIKASASSRPEDLLHFYRTTYYPWNVLLAETILCKSDIVEQYLKKS